MKGVKRGSSSRGFVPHVAIVPAAKARDGYNFGSSHAARLDHSSPGRIFVRGIVDTVRMIVVDVITNQPT
jgi:hypothetical protein